MESVVVEEPDPVELLAEFSLKVSSRVPVATQAPDTTLAVILNL
jgi:hypothetical protein